MTRWSLLICLPLVFLVEDSFAETIPSDIKQIVTFIYTETEKPKDKATLKNLSRFCEDTKLGQPVFLCPSGTGFFVGVADPADANLSSVYLVTAKHVLFDSKTKSLIPRIVTRMNRRGGTLLRGEIPLVPEGRDKTVYFHTDPTVDLAVIPTGWPKTDVIDGKWLPETLVISKSDIKSFHIEEGTEVFFTGLFLHHIGAKRNHPIFRFGHFSLVTEEKILWVDEQEAELFLMETPSYGGNSGSPVFFFFDADRQAAGLPGGPVRLAGVMSGAFRDIDTPFHTNIGIAGVVPSYKLLEILHGNELEERRKKASQKVTSREFLYHLPC